MLTPGVLYRIEPATGTAAKSIRLKASDESEYKYIPVQEVKLNWEQTFSVAYLIQGGARASVADISERILKGKITMPLRVDSAGAILPGIKSILRSAEFSTNGIYLQIDTNHLLSPDIQVPIPESHATESVSFLTIDTCLISNLQITGRSGGVITLSFDIVGIVDARSLSQSFDLDDVDLSGRELMFQDCKAHRFESRIPMSMFDVNVKSEIKEDVYLPSLESNVRSDQVQYISVKSWKATGKYEQFVKRYLEKSSFIKGGIMTGENLTIEIGPLKIIYRTPMFEITTQDIDTKLIKRTASFTNLSTPHYTENEGVGFFVIE